MPTKAIHQPRFIPPVLDVCEVKPNEDYDSLKRQFFALRNLLNAKNAYLYEYHKKDYELAILEAQGNIDSLDSERDMNCQLTNENIMLYKRLEQADKEIEKLKRIIQSKALP